MNVRKRIVTLCTSLTLVLTATLVASAQDVGSLKRPAGDKEAVGGTHHPVRLHEVIGQPKIGANLAAPRAPLVVLYDQTDNPDADSFNSQNFEAAYDEYDNQGADDFVVPGAGWVVSTVVTPGVYFNGAGPATSLHVTFSADSGGLPGAIVPGCDYPAVTTFTGGATGSFATTLSPPCTLPPGPKWVSVQANMSFLVGGQWGWTMRDVQSFNPSVWRNPGGGFPGGCAGYTARTVCEPLTAASPDQVFRLEGAVASCSGDADCQDGNLCNGVEHCIASSCSPGTPVNCDDGLFCTIDSCAPATGACTNAPNPCSDGDSCSLDFCDETADTCSHVSPAPIRRCSTGPISIPDSGTATPYPATINVSGLSTTASLCSVELAGISHTFPNDIDILLVAPGTAQNAIVMSDVGGTSAASGVNLTLKDAAAASIPSPLASGTFKPTNVGSGDTFAGAPAPTGGSALSAFDGTNPNGDWKLYVVDDVGGDSGSIAGGWCVNLVVSGCANDAQCNDGNACNGTETCSSGSCTPGTPVNCNDGLFCTIDACNPADGTCSHVANSCADSTSCTLDGCDEANHVCVHTDVSVHLCSTGAITIPSIGPASPYPTAITVAGQPTSGSVCSVELHGLTHTFPDDIDVLLARTSGANALIMSDVGGGTAVTGVNLTLDDGAAASLPDGPPLVSGTFKPTNSNTGGADSAFAAPAPAISGPSALSTFDGQDPNGTWNLWVRDEFSGDSGSFSGGWCLNLVVNSCTGDAECADGNACNGVETCVAGSCTPGTPINCDDGQFCTLDTCDPASGTCGHPPNPCGDGDGCTADSCDEAGDTCVHVNACTQVCNNAPIAINDSPTPPTTATPYPSPISVAAPHGQFTLVSVQILGINHTFPDDIEILLSGPSTALTATLMSDVGGSAAASGVDLTIADGAPSIPDTGPLVSGTFSGTNVNPGTGTEGWPAPAPAPTGGTALSQFDGTDPDGNWNLWVVDDQGLDSGTITNGWCLNYRISCSTPADCDDGNACTTDACDPQQGCTHSGLSCDDNNPCTDDTCDAGTGCGHSNNTNACNDGNACTANDTCGGGTCNGGPAVVCDDGNACTDDSCNPASGCVATNNTNACDDGNACTVGDVCGGGSCHAGAPVVCTASDQCHDAGTCNPGSGTCSNPAKPNGSTCDDGNSGTVNDTCQAGVCTGGGSACNSSNDPKTKGWYKSLCHNAHSGDSLTDADALCVGALTDTFAGISHVSDICAVLEPSQPNNDQCSKAEDQLMTLALNICKQRVCPSNAIDSTCGSNDNVGQSLDESDAIFNNPSRTNAQCDHAECLDKEINNGHALELDTLVLSRDLGKVRLTWVAPNFDDGLGSPSSYKIWRRPMGSNLPFVLIGTTTNTTYLDASAGTGAWQYDLTTVN